MLVEAVGLALALALAAAAALVSTARAARERRRLRKICASCGRIRLFLERTCDCD